MDNQSYARSAAGRRILTRSNRVQRGGLLRWSEVQRRGSNRRLRSGIKFSGSGADLDADLIPERLNQAVPQSCVMRVWRWIRRKRTSRGGRQSGDRDARRLGGREAILISGECSGQQGFAPKLHAQCDLPFCTPRPGSCPQSWAGDKMSSMARRRR